MATNIRSIKRMRLIKRLGIIFGAISTFGLAITLILAFLPRDNDSFSIQIDNWNGSSETESGGKVSNASKLVMSNTEEGAVESDKSVTYYAGTPIKNGFTTEASYVEEYLNSLEKLEGSQNFVDEKDGYGKAIVYTVYMRNPSTEEPLNLDFRLVLDNYKAPDNDAYSPLEYLRVLTRRSFVGSNELPENVYFGMKRSERWKTMYPSDIDNPEDHEPISSRKTSEDDDGNTILIKDFESNGNLGYCKDFSDVYQTTGNLIDGEELHIPSEQTLCFTVAIFFEAKDLDCSGASPINSKVQMSVHFAIK